MKKKYYTFPSYQTRVSRNGCRWFLFNGPLIHDPKGLKIDNMKDLTLILGERKEREGDSHSKMTQRGIGMEKNSWLNKIRFGFERSYK